MPRSTGSQESDTTERLRSNNRPAISEESPHPLVWFPSWLKQLTTRRETLPYISQFIFYQIFVRDTEG